MPQGVRGKARKISDEIIIDSDRDDADDAVASVDNRGTKEQLAAQPAQPVPDSEKNLALDVDLPELSDDSLPAAVSTDKLQHAPGQRGIKRKISALVPKKQTPSSAEGKYY
jgi:hypothetical protein